MNDQQKAIVQLMEMIFAMVETCDEYYALDLNNVQKFIAAKEIFLEYWTAMQRPQEQKKSTLFNIDWNSFMKMRNGEC